MEYWRQVAMQRDGDDFVIAFETRWLHYFPQARIRTHYGSSTGRFAGRSSSDATSSADELTPWSLVPAESGSSLKTTEPDPAQNRCRLERRAANAPSIRFLSVGLDLICCNIACQAARRVLFLHPCLHGAHARRRCCVVCRRYRGIRCHRPVRWQCHGALIGLWREPTVACETIATEAGSIGNNPPSRGLHVQTPACTGRRQSPDLSPRRSESRCPTARRSGITCRPICAANR